MRNTIAYTVEYKNGFTVDSKVIIPENEIMRHVSKYTYKALRGYAYSLAVFNPDDECIGWIKTSSLGFNNAKEWLNSEGK